MFHKNILLQLISIGKFYVFIYQILVNQDNFIKKKVSIGFLCIK
jgi:hypothetical protein